MDENAVLANRIRAEYPYPAIPVPITCTSVLPVMEIRELSKDMTTQPQHAIESLPICDANVTYTGRPKICMRAAAPSDPLAVLHIMLLDELQRTASHSVIPNFTRDVIPIAPIPMPETTTLSLPLLAPLLVPMDLYIQVAKSRI